MSPRLITIPISHFGERARWALDHAEIDYDEVHTLQMFSWVHAYGLGGGKTLPVLVLGDGILRESVEIVRWASGRARAPLYPREAAQRALVEAFEDDLSRGYAVEARKVAYGLFLRDEEQSLPYNAGRAPEWQVAVVRSSRPLVRLFVRRYLEVNEATLARAVGETDRTLDAIGERMRDGRAFLFGDRIGAADVAFAAFSAAVLLPEQYPVPLPPVDALPDDLRRRTLAWRAHPAGAFAMRLYASRPPTRGRTEEDLRVDRRAAPEQNP